jgi:hypothetical protein
MAGIRAGSGECGGQSEAVPGKERVKRPSLPTQECQQAEKKIPFAEIDHFASNRAFLKRYGVADYY